MLPFNRKNIYINHTYIINKIIERYKFKTYLEIGVDNPDGNYNNIVIENKEGCDIEDRYNIGLTYVMTSDDMFKSMPKDKKYDIIFIDGMHDCDYVDRDITNSLKHLNKGGFICIHHSIPCTKEAQLKLSVLESIGALKNNTIWNGDVWKSIVKLNCVNLPFFTIDNGDYGLTVIPYFTDINEVNLENYSHSYEYEDLFLPSKNTFNCLNLQGRYLLHVIDLYDFEAIFNIKL